MALTRLSRDEFGTVFDLFGRTAFRLETLPRYAVSDEAGAFEDFLAGRAFGLEWLRPWLDSVRRMAHEGRRIQRVRIVDEPPTDYQRFELAVAPANVAAGEDIRVVARSTAGALGLPRRDFWLFDEVRVVSMDFDVHGALIGADVEDDPARVAWGVAARDLALAHARYNSGIRSATDGTMRDGR